MELSWDEKIAMLSINPDAASRDDVARLAAELMECRRLLGIEEEANMIGLDGGEPVDRKTVEFIDRIMRGGREAT